MPASSPKATAAAVKDSLYSSGGGSISGLTGDAACFDPLSAEVDKVKFIESLMDSFRHIMSHNVGIHRDAESLKKHRIILNRH